MHHGKILERRRVYAICESHHVRRVLDRRHLGIHRGERVMDDHILVLLDLEGAGCAQYWIDRAVCERAVRIAEKRGLPELTARDYARLAAITQARAEGVRLSPRIKELCDA